MQPWRKSKINDIKLVTLCYESSVKKYGISEMIISGSGHNLYANVNVKGSLVAFVGDN